MSVCLSVCLSVISLFFIIFIFLNIFFLFLFYFHLFNISFISFHFISFHFISFHFISFIIYHLSFIFLTYNRLLLIASGIIYVNETDKEAPGYNIFRQLLSSIDSNDSMNFLFAGFVRLLNNSYQSDSSYLPYSITKVAAEQVSCHVMSGCQHVWLSACLDVCMYVCMYVCWCLSV